MMPVGGGSLARWLRYCAWVEFVALVVAALAVALWALPLAWVAMERRENDL